MNHRGYTLLELMVSMILTVMLVATLFRFSFFFWRQFHLQQEVIEFHQESLTYFDWMESQCRQAIDIQEKDDRLVFTSLDGTQTTCLMGEGGPRMDSLAFFEDPVDLTWEFRHDQGEVWLRLDLSRGPHQRSQLIHVDLAHHLPFKEVVYGD